MSEKAELLYEQARALPHPQRAAFVEAACRGDPRLRDELASLLEHADAAEEFFDLLGAAVVSPLASLASLGRDGAPDGGAAARSTAEPEWTAGRTIGQYEIVARVGRGGMATVYRARDLRHHRSVAVKVLHSELSAVLGPERFLKEIEVTAALQHPHILPLFDSGQDGSRLYYVMPYVEGETLRARLGRERQLPVGEAVRLVRELADALVYAHAEGVVHRDLKPENVLLSGGHAVVADFGVAKALASATQGGAAPGANATSTALGLAVGTPAYMAPEQAAADPAADHRADLYALGLIAYEALAGQHPFGGRTPQAMLAAHLTEAPPPLAARRPDLPLALGALVTRLLEKRPEDRPQSAQEVVRALDTPATPAGAAPVGSTAPAEVPTRHRPVRRVAVAAGVAVALAAAGAAVWARRPAASAPREASSPAGAHLVERRVAVAPFENRTRDSALAALGALTSDWVTQGLAEAAFAEVVDPETARSAWQAGPNARALAAATGARLVVSGAYYLEGDTLRLLARITDAADGTLLRAVEPVSAPAAGPRRAVATLRERVVGAVGGILDVQSRPGTTETDLPPSLTAYRNWSAGLDQFHRNAFREAIPEFLAAARLDSTFVSPVMWTGIAYSALGEPAKADSFFRIASRARDHLAPVDRALLDAAMAENRGDWAGALRAGREAARLAPTLSAVHIDGAWNAMRTNHPREAIAALTRLDPERPPARGYPPYWELLTQAHHQLGDYHGELAAATRGRRVHPDYVPLVYAEGRALAALGRAADASQRLGEVLALAPDPFYTPGELIWLLGRELRVHGQEEAAQEVFGRALRWYDARSATEQASAALRGRRAEVLYALGRWDEARRLFEALAAEYPGEPNPIGDKGALGLPRLGEVDYRGYIGALAARRGDRAAALLADSALAALQQPYLLGRHTYWRARIASLLGERERAVALLREALQEGRTHLVVHAEADFAALRDLPAFRELVRPKG